MMRGSTAACYAAATLIGVAAAAAMLPWAVVTGTGGLWRAPGGDVAMALTGHLAYQAPGWHWPLLLAADLAWPDGRSIALTDSNPLVSLAAKLAAGLLGRPVNLLGGWLALCWVLQPVAALFAYRCLCRRLALPCRWEAGTAVAVLALLCPAWLTRIRHVNLMSHCVLLAALALSLRMRNPQARDWAPAALLLGAAILIHPYLFVFAALMLAAPVLGVLIGTDGRPWRAVPPYVASCALPLALLLLCSGTSGGIAPGFGHYSMNLASPVWPQLSGIFGARLPILDATGGQYEGFNYQGAGVLLLVLVAAATLLRRRPRLNAGQGRALAALLLPLGVLACLAVSPRIYAGRWLVLGLPMQPWHWLFGAIQSSGRAFWLVGYAMLIGAVAVLSARLPRAWAGGILAAAAVLQAVDTAPVRAATHAFLLGSLQAAPPFVPAAGATLLRIVPACDPVNAPADQLRLLAVRAGLRLADMRMARTPRGFDCETARATGLETPLAPGEMRFFLPSATADFRPAALGAGAACAGLKAGILCTGNGLPPPAGTPAAPGAALAELPAGPVTLGGDRLAPLLSAGWRRDKAGIFWSEGPTATLLFQAGASPSITLVLGGVAGSAGGRRTVSIRVNEGVPRQMVLDDLGLASVTLGLPPMAGQPVRVELSCTRPVDPARRHLVAPVRRAAVRLFALLVA